MKIFKVLSIPILMGGLSANIASADFVFGEPTVVPNVNTSSFDGCGSITADGLELYMASFHPHGGDACHGDIYVATRSTIHEAWRVPVKLGPPVNTHGPEGSPSISADGLELYFTDGWGPLLFVGGCSHRPGGYGGTDIWVSTRTTRDDPWGEPQNLGPEINVSDGGGELFPVISPDGLFLYFNSHRTGGSVNHDIYVAHRPTKNDPWGPPESLGPLINTNRSESNAFISPDNLTLYFSRSSPDLMSSDIYMSRRAAVTDPWEAPVPIGDLNSALSEDTLIFAPGTSTLYFNRGENFAGHKAHTFPATMVTFDIWQVEVTPVIDLNRDMIIDAEDVCIMIDHWHTNEPLCDIAPIPMGDGVVDVEDLKVLAEHLFEEIYPPGLTAYWKLDEAEGGIAYNSVSDNHGVLRGNPTWQPEMGNTGGALECDGIDDYIDAGFVLNPADGPFSVLAWIKGGAPGEVIVAQADGTGSGETWLGTNASVGNLMTGLVPPPTGRSLPQPLESEVLVTDGKWHHVGFVWDGACRILYVEGAEVAKDTGVQKPLQYADGGLVIGAAENLHAGTYWSGMIDDVRIYNRAVKP